MNNETDLLRQAMIETDQVQEDLAADSGRKWTTTQLTEEFDVLGFAAPFVTVQRRSDGQLGSLEFTNSPRVYFSFVPHSE